MSVTTASAQIHGPRNWMRVVLLTAGFALLITSTPHPAGAEKQDPTQTGTGYVIVCEHLGGEADVEVDRTVKGVDSVTVSCKGGGLDGWTCKFDSQGHVCVSAERLGVRSDVWEHRLLAEVAEAVESGSELQLNAALAEFEADLNAARTTYEADPAKRQVVVYGPDDEQARDGDKNHDGKAKHGKQGGKHRKR